MLIGWVIFAIAALTVTVIHLYRHPSTRTDSNSAASRDEARARENCRPLSTVTVVGASQASEHCRTLKKPANSG